LCLFIYLSNCFAFIFISPYAIYLFTRFVLSSGSMPPVTLRSCDVSSHRMQPQIVKQVTKDGSSVIQSDLVSMATDKTLAVSVPSVRRSPPTPVTKRYCFVPIFSLIPLAAEGVSDLLHNVTGYRVFIRAPCYKDRVEALQKYGGV
jgi:hypothetical protein